MRAAEREGEAGDLAHVDGDEACGGGVDGDGADRGSRPGAHEQCIEDETQGDREAEGDQPVHGNRRPGDGDRDREIRIAVVLPAEQDEGDALNHEEQAEGRQDRVDLEGIPRLRPPDERHQQHPIDEPAGREAGRQHQDHPDERTEREGGEEQVGGEGGGDENLAIGEVHDPRDAVLEREAHGDEGIHAAEDQAAENDVDDQHDDLKGQRLRLPGRLGAMTGRAPSLVTGATP